MTLLQATPPILLLALLLALLAGPWPSARVDAEALVEGFGNDVVVGALVAALCVAIAATAAPLLLRHRVADADADADAEGDGAEATPARRTHLPRDDDRCSICYDAFSHPVDTNCQHTFCAACLEGYWRHGTHTVGAAVTRTLNCPLCRQNVNLLLPVKGVAAGDGNASELAKRAAFVADFNANYAGLQRTFRQQLRDAPMLCGRLCTLRGAVWLLSHGRVVLIAVASLAYLLAPFDLLPEAVFGVVGLIDDVLVLAVGLAAVLGALRSFLVAEHAAVA